MRKTIIVLLVAVAVVGVAGIASARMNGNYAQQSSDGQLFGQMYQWMGQHMGRWGGSMMGYGQYGAADGICPIYGSGYYQLNKTTTDLITIEEAQQLIEQNIDGTVTSEVYPMRHWYIALYEDSNGITKQVRVDMFTGVVYADFYGYMSEYSGTYNDRKYAGPGWMMWG